MTEPNNFEPDIDPDWEGDPDARRRWDAVHAQNQIWFEMFKDVEE